MTTTIPGAIHYPVKLGLRDKDRTTKEMVVCRMSGRIIMQTITKGLAGLEPPAWARIKKEVPSLIFK